MWNNAGWKSVIIKVDSWQQRRLWIMWIVNIANFTLKLMSGQLIAELTLKWLPNWSSLFCHAKIRRHSTSATRDQQITHTNNLKIDIVDVGLPTSSTSTHRRRRHRLWGCGRGSTQVLKERKRRKGSRKSYSLNTNWCLQAKWKNIFKASLSSTGVIGWTWWKRDLRRITLRISDFNRLESSDKKNKKRLHIPMQPLVW